VKNFITGAGGLLQTILFGYGGIRIHDSSLHIDPHLLPDVSEWTIKGLKYKGFELDINHIQIKSFVIIHLLLL
jgi:trehalose/maltose hydrolase-like predicted phosphorylase